MAKRVQAKRSCCQSRPRCKRCPVVLDRLERAGAAKRTGKRSYALRKRAKQAIKSARRR